MVILVCLYSNGIHQKLARGLEQDMLGQRRGHWGVCVCAQNVHQKSQCLPAIRADSQGKPVRRARLAGEGIPLLGDTWESWFFAKPRPHEAANPHGNWLLLICACYLRVLFKKWAPSTLETTQAARVARVLRASSARLTMGATAPVRAGAGPSSRALGKRVLEGGVSVSRAGSWSLKASAGWRLGWSLLDGPAKAGLCGLAAAPSTW